MYVIIYIVYVTMIKVTSRHTLKIKRRKDSKKGDNGRVLIVGGSKEYVGALALAGLACMRTGVDWVTITAPQKVSWAINCLTPDIVTIKLSGEYLGLKHKTTILRLAQKHDAILLGNGAGLLSDTRRLFKALVHKIPLPIVIDADAIKALSPKDFRKAIITPHAKEAEIFFRQRFSRPPSRAHIHDIQNKIHKNTVILLKGPTDFIITKKSVYYNTTGNSGMTRAGTGDVLAGLCVGYLAQSKDLLKSAITAAYVNGKIGDMLLKKRKGEYSFLASDLINDYKKIKKSL